MSANFLTAALLALHRPEDPWVATNVVRGPLVSFVRQWREDPAAARAAALAWLRQRVALRRLLAEFVERWGYRPLQRTPPWYELKKGEMGGTDLVKFKGGITLSAVLRLVAQKTGVTEWFCSRQEALDWGTVLENALERLVEIDFGLELMGADLSVPAPYASGLRGYHSNSPDGYGVATFFLEGGAWHLRTTDAATLERARGRPTKQEICLFEFKNPITREPKGRVPSYYVPQLWSGTAVASAVVDRAVFVEGVHRRCAFGDLGPAPGYDLTFHAEDDAWKDRDPVAWGFTALFVPAAPVPREERALLHDGRRAPEPAWFAAKTRRRYAREGLLVGGLEFADPKHGVCDFGAGPAEDFIDALNAGATKRYETRTVGPCFPDGRGDARLLTPEGRAAAVEAEWWNPPAGTELLGVFGWKLMHVSYLVEDPNPGFLEAVGPEVREVCGAIRKIRAADSVNTAYQEWAAAMRARWATKSRLAAIAADAFDEDADWEVPTAADFESMAS